MADQVNPNYVTSFNSYSLEYQWKITKVLGRLSMSQSLSCPEVIKSPPGKLPVHQWSLEALGANPTHYFVTLRHNYYAARVWARAKIGVKVKDTTAPLHHSPRYVTKYLSVSPSCNEPNTVERYPSTGTIDYSSFVGTIPKGEFSKYLDGDDIIIYCHIFVNGLGNPVHVKSVPVVEAKSSQFDLSKLLEDARHKERCTDVTIVTSEKEFKAHKVVLVSQSAFFETRLEERWTEHGGNRIEMRDVPAVTMDTILTYMYTGKVADIDKAAHELLPRADEYQLDGLKTLCEEALCKSLTAQSVIDILVMADTHNAPNLKQSCLTFIAKNISDVKKSSAWTEGKLKSEENKDLWVEVLEYIVDLM